MPAVQRFFGIGRTPLTKFARGRGGLRQGGGRATATATAVAAAAAVAGAGAAAVAADGGRDVNYKALIGNLSLRPLGLYIPKRERGRVAGGGQRGQETEGSVGTPGDTVYKATDPPSLRLSLCLYILPFFLLSLHLFNSP
jgi:hypothetical protein